jgi:hypothetical protein
MQDDAEKPATDEKETEAQPTPPDAQARREGRREERRAERRAERAQERKKAAESQNSAESKG